MNIFKSFEEFLKEPLSVLNKNRIQIVSLITDNIFAHKPACEVSLTKSGAQITLVNNDKMYNLLSLVTKKAQLKEEENQKTILR